MIASYANFNPPIVTRHCYRRPRAETDYAGMGTGSLDPIRIREKRVFVAQSTLIAATCTGVVMTPKQPYASGGG